MENYELITISACIVLAVIVLMVTAVAYLATHLPLLAILLAATVALTWVRRR